MNLKDIARWAWGLCLAVGLTISGVATAASVSGTPREPASLLYDQTDQPGSHATDSSDLGSNFSNFASRAADDFVVPNNLVWHITTVTVLGENSGSTGGGVQSVTVQLYSNSTSNLPDVRLFSRTIGSSGITGLASGSLAVTLSPAEVLGPGHYWLAIQAHEQCPPTNCQTWNWKERMVQTNTASTWENPSGIVQPACRTWQLRVATCHRPADSSGPDLLFSVAGTSIQISARLLLPVVSR